MYKNFISLIVVVILLAEFADINASPLTPLRLSGKRNRRHASPSKFFDDLAKIAYKDGPPNFDRFPQIHDENDPYYNDIKFVEVDEPEEEPLFHNK